jgi:hypothetical protein
VDVLEPVVVAAVAVAEPQEGAHRGQARAARCVWCSIVDKTEALGGEGAKRAEEKGDGDQTKRGW